MNATPGEASWLNSFSHRSSSLGTISDVLLGEEGAEVHGLAGVGFQRVTNEPAFMALRRVKCALVRLPRCGLQHHDYFRSEA
jgi:hypothetical protein